MNTHSRKKLVLEFFTYLTNLIAKITGGNVMNLRLANVSIQAQVEDWYYPPYKAFYSIGEIVELFQDNGFHAECLQEQVGRIKSTTIFVVKGIKLWLRIF